MSQDLNYCSFIGRLGKDPESRSTPGGDTVANFNIAVGSSWKDKATGEKKESVEWVSIVAWRQLAEICVRYLKKGSKVFISGKMKTRKWQDKDGRDHYKTEVIAEQMQMLGDPKSGTDQAAEPAERPQAHYAGDHATPQQPAPSSKNFEDDDIPFR